jgi:glycosyltransferase involved in cell wall biosynthesis
LQAKGHEVFVGLAPKAALRDELSFLLPERVAEFPLRGAIDYVSARAIANFARAQNIDLIHAHVARDYTIAAMASSRTGIPFGITRHVLFPMSRLHRMFLRNVRFVIAPSSAVARSLSAQAIFPANKIVTIRHGLNADDYPFRDPIGRDTFVVGSMGNLDPVKGFDVLIRAAKTVLERLPRTRFVIAGESRSASKKTEGELRELVAQLRLGKHVEFSGWSDDVKKTLVSFDIFVSASRSESFGYAIAEAMLLGVPVIATETEGAKEIISDPSAGMLVPVESPGVLADAIVRLLSEPAKHTSNAKAARSHNEKTFSIEAMIDSTESVYERAIGNR